MEVAFDGCTTGICTKFFPDLDAFYGCSSIVRTNSILRDENEYLITVDNFDRRGPSVTIKRKDGELYAFSDTRIVKCEICTSKSHF